MARFLVDSFGTNHVNLSSRTPETGGSWVSLIGAATTSAGRVRHAAVNSDNVCYRNTAAPADADYWVEGPIYRASATAQMAGVAGRIDPGASQFDWYMVTLDDSQDEVQIISVAGGGPTELGAVAVTPPTAGTSQIGRLTMDGNQISADFNGVEVIAPVTNNVHTDAGQAGLFIAYLAGSSDTTGLHLESIDAENDLGGGGTPRPIAAESSQPQTGSAALLVTRPVAATSSQPQTGSAGLTVTRPVAASSSQPQTGSGALQVTRPLAAASVQPQTGTAALQVQKPVAAATSQPQTGAVSLEVGSAPEIAAESSQPQTGAASLLVGKVIAATGTMPQIGEVALLVIRPIAASSSQPQTGSAALQIGDVFVAQGYLSGTISRSPALSGAVSRSSALSGTVARAVALSATITRRP